MDESLNNVIKLEENLKKILPYIRYKEISRVVNWAQEDVSEMKKIKKELMERGLFEKANLIKEKTNYQIKKKDDIQKNILEVYKIIAKELEEWRWIYLKMII